MQGFIFHNKIFLFRVMKVNRWKSNTFTLTVIGSFDSPIHVFGLLKEQTEEKSSTLHKKQTVEVVNVRQLSQYVLVPFDDMKGGTESLNFLYSHTL